MPSSQRNKALFAAGAVALLLSACGPADYLNNWDTSSARSGDAMEANTAIQELEAWPPAAYRTTVGSGG
ncbi:hypothetical protein PVT71_20590 [Salipiger sp. H15]|uniref:Uncharacterized protein n=1 Tax=Alloyangia sp. H15 TaxID=3029062 RepID=A0AAU8ALV0_9RHOB